MALCALIDVHQLASVVKNRIENVLIIDSRSFIDYNSCHVVSAVNVCCSKIVKRRLQQDKLSVKELLAHACHCDADDSYDVIVYDQHSNDLESLPTDSFTSILFTKLHKTFCSVHLLSGGFTEFYRLYADLCGDKVRKFPPLSSLSQPCLPIADQGPTRILPFLYLGSQSDALNKDILKDHNITYELNVSTTCPKPDFLSDSHFMRIPVNDNYSEKLISYFPDAFRFIDKVSEASCCVLIHCLAGISRSPTVAIAYVMRYLRLTSDDGYRYVKSKRPTISPNFNFLGQLLDFEKRLKLENFLDSKSNESTASSVGSKKRFCKADMRKAPMLSLHINTELGCVSRAGDQSPTTALARLSFSSPSTPEITHSPGLKCSKSFECVAERISTRNDKASKILSPVKEFKCEALVSEISWGNTEQIASLSRDNLQTKYATTRTYRTRTEILQPYVWSQTEKCHTKNNDQEKSKLASAFSFPSKNRETVKCANYSEMIAANVSPEPLPHFTEGASLLPVHQMQHAIYIRSDSGATSGFGSESSDCLEESVRTIDGSKIEFNVEDLEDDVISESSNNAKLKRPVKGREGHFSFTFPEVPASQLQQNLRSPLSPSELHLLEDLVTDPSNSSHQFATYSPIITGPLSVNHLDSRQNSLMEQTSWSRKRTAHFDDPSLSQLSCFRTELQHPDKRKCELSNESALLVENRTVKHRNEIYTAAQFSEASFSPVCPDFGLYRVQSCPGMSSSCERNSLKTTNKYQTVSNGPIFHRHSIDETGSSFGTPDSTVQSAGSCPDVLYTVGHVNRPHSTPSSPHHRDFRRNIRLIRVS